MLSIRIGATVLLVGLSSSVAKAQDYPTRPITIVVPFEAGGPSDVLARNLGSTMNATLKQQMIIENVGGAVPLGIARASRAHPDGYTILMTHVGIATAPFLYRRLPYDTINDFEPIGRVSDVRITIVAKKALPPNQQKAFICY